MARTQKNKNTAYHLGTLKAKLAKLRRELLTPKGGSGGASEGIRRDFVCLDELISLFSFLSLISHFSRVRCR